MGPESGRTYLAETGSHDLAAQIREARLIRAQIAAEIITAGFAWLGRPLRPLARRLARRRELARLRRTFTALDARTLRDLGLSPQSAEAITPEALADHPLAASNRWQIANENATRRQARSAA